MEKDTLSAKSFISPWLNLYSVWMSSVYEAAINYSLDSAMRRYIRHPSEIPITYEVDRKSGESKKLRDVSRGGLCFTSGQFLQKGHTISIEISLNSEKFKAEGRVAWCRSEGDHFSVGVQFDDNSTQFSVRMVEQICHIEHYRSIILEREGRLLSSEQAAEEWVEKYAADFPSS